MKSISLAIIFTILALSTTSTQGWRIPKNKPAMKSPLSISDKLKLPPIDSIQSAIKAKALPALLGSIFLLSNPSDSSALSSGGRSGGSSFRSSSSMRSYSTTTRSYSPSINYGSSYISPVMPIMPYYNPFMPSIFFGPSLSNIVLTVALLYVASQFLGRLGGSSFGQSVSESATVIKLNLALNSDWGYDGIIPTITNIASRSGDLSDRSELSRLLSETTLALLRKSNDWVAVSHEAKTFSGDGQDTESFFQKLAIKERAKFDKEIRPSPLMIENGSKSSLAVVSLVVAVTGKNNPSYKSVKSISDTREILQALAADAMTDDGNNIMAMELLWSPDSPSSTITDRDLIVDYPELIRL